MSGASKEERKWTKDDYSIERVIGEGSYGRALLATDKKTNQLIVVKEISFANLTQQEKNDALRETMILSLLNHPNIIGYRGSFIDKNIFHIIMDYADGGDLSEQIENCGADGFPEGKILNWFVQICLALKHIHDRKILHRDLKTQNIFLMRNGTVKLGDFGIAKVLDHTTAFTKTSIGTPYYLSPEICQGKSYNAKSDIWALGCVLYEMCTRKHPFDSNNINGLIMKITRAKQAPIPKVYSSKLAELVDTLLQKAPTKRPNINQILKIDFIQDKIGNLLSSTLRKIEFSHTIFHGVKGGITPDFIADGHEEKEKPLSGRKVSNIPAKKIPAAKGSARGSSNISKQPSQPIKPVPKPTPKPNSKPTQKSSPITKPTQNKPTSGKGPSRPITTNRLNTPGVSKCDKKVAIAAAHDREAQNARREAEFEEKQRYDEEQERKRKEVERRQHERELERKKEQERIRKDNIERKKAYQNLEAPFKAVKNKTSPKQQNEDPKMAEIHKKIPERPKSRPANEKEATRRPAAVREREKDVSNLREMIRQKKAAAKAMKNNQDQIQIGTMTFNMNGEQIDNNGNVIKSEKPNKPESTPKKEEKVQEEKKEPMRVEDLILEFGEDTADDDDLFNLAAIAQNMRDNPPEEDENVDDEEDTSPTVFLFKGKPVELPPYDGPDPVSYQNEAIRKFIEKGIGPEKLVKVYHLVTDQSEQLTEDQCDAELAKILTTPEEMEYYPLVQQLVVSEGLNE